MKACFVLMPLIKEMRAVYDDAIYPVIQEVFDHQCQCSKADDERRPGMVTEKVVLSLLNADFVIAVTADPREKNAINPNVMYELGIAHSFRKPTIVISDCTDAMPFDLRAVETIQLDFSRFRSAEQRAAFLAELCRALEKSLRTPEVFDESRKRIPRNPITTQLSGTRIFIEDLPWLQGYTDVLKREREAQTIWEITRDLFWPSEPLFFASIKSAIRDGRKHYFMVPAGEGIHRKAEAIKNQLRRDEVPEEDIEKLLYFVEIDPKYFVLWPLAIVLYDADLATSRGGIICEPMTGEVGLDPIDGDIRRLFVEHVKSGGGLDTFTIDFDWVEKRREATFDIELDGRVVDALATSFAKLWNEKIAEEANKKTSKQEQTALLNTWLIGG
jgi:nucleoside 2-deoxyribosyltransferase